MTPDCFLDTSLPVGSAGSFYVNEMLKPVVLALCVLVSVCACARQQPLIRVAITPDAEALQLSLKGLYRVTDLATGKKLRSGWWGTCSALSVCEQQLCLDARQLETASVRVQASRGIGVQSGGNLTWYRGSLDILTDASGRLRAVNQLGIEDYLGGVIPREVPASWPKAALQAQAVASRTYALYRMEQARELDYDVSADVLSQVYGGRSAEKRRTNRALKRTRGKAMVHENQLIPAFFHASCGGHTESAQMVWGLDSAVLKGTACPYCIDRPAYTWKRNFHSRAVQELLNSRGYTIGRITDIEIEQRSPSGRAVALHIHDHDNATLTIPATEFRALLGPDIVRSTRFEIIMKGYFFDLAGYGWGHGIGMCQQGACGMALAGKNMLEILRFYYNGITVKTMY
jgi:stage II sporulation protein D